MTGAAQGVDASRVVFAFARDNALPGSRWWKRINPRTQTPVNAVWFVIAGAAVCGLLGFSAAALSSLAGYVELHSVKPVFSRSFRSRASVIGLYVSYATPIFLRITSGRNKLVPGTFSLGRWYMPIGIIAVAWVSFIVVLLVFPPTQTATAAGMSTYNGQFHGIGSVADRMMNRLRRRNYHGCFLLCVHLLDRVST